MKSGATRAARSMAKPLQRKIASLKSDKDPKFRKIGEAMGLQWSITEILLNIEEGRTP
jgi:hypothetical protein